MKSILLFFSIFFSICTFADNGKIVKTDMPSRPDNMLGYSIDVDLASFVPLRSPCVEPRDIKSELVPLSRPSFRLEVTEEHDINLSGFPDPAKDILVFARFKAYTSTARHRYFQSSNPISSRPGACQRGYIVGGYLAGESEFEFATQINNPADRAKFIEELKRTSPNLELFLRNEKVAINNSNKWLVRYSTTGSYEEYLSFEDKFAFCLFDNLKKCSPNWIAEIPLDLERRYPRSRISSLVFGNEKVSNPDVGDSASYEVWLK